jgi:hypothetical protein
MSEKIKIDFKFYILVNSHGLFYRPRGRSGYGDIWVEDVKKAKAYQNIGTAKAQVSYFSKDENYIPPRIVEISADHGEILDMTEYVQAARIKREKKEAAYQKRIAAYQLKQAEESFEKAKKALDAAKGKK